MKPPERIETERLILRVPSIADATAIFNSYARDDEVLRYLIWRPHKDLTETESFLSGCVAAWKGDRRFPYVIMLKQSSKAIGMIEMRLDGFKVDVGYVVARPFWGEGLATECLRVLIDWALTQESTFRVWALCDVENAASARVLEKVGMQREGILHRQIIHPNISDEPRDCYCYAIVR